MHFAIIAPPLRGHFQPLNALAEELIARGNAVTFVHQEDARALVDAPGAKFAPIGGGADPLASWTRPMAKIRGLIGLGRTMRRMRAFTTMFCREAPDLLRTLKIDAVIADQLEPGGGLVAAHLGMPWITTATTIPMNREMGVPPPYVGWAFDPSAAGIKRNRGGWRVSDLIMRGYNRVIAREARRLGLGRCRGEDCFSPLLQIAQSVAEIDFPRTQLPDAFHYTGPWRGTTDGAFAPPKGDGRPLVYASLGTLQGARIALFRKFAEACRDAGMRLVLTHGGALDREAIGTLPGDPIVFDWVPQQALLGQVDFVICHGGMNTVLDSLAAELPLIVVPLAFEQAGIGARVQHSGAGLMLKRWASAREIAAALAQLREDSDYRTRAQEIAVSLKAAGGVGRAADLIEQALGASARTATPTTGRAARGDAHGGSRSGSRSAAT